VGGDEPVKKGQRAIFYTNAWVFGESLAVQSIGHEEPGAAAAVAAAANPVEALSLRRLQQHFGEADLVVTGRVASIRLPSGEARSQTETAAPAGQHFSEHDAIWRVAQVEIDDVHKGEHAAKTVDVGYPSSTDVMWAHAPKLHPGQEGHFLLHREPAIRETPGADLGDYIVLHPADFQPLEQPGGIKDVIAASQSARRRR
jgi:hypothetical protein